MRLIFARVLSAFFILFVLFAATRCLIRVLPGDPLLTALAESGTSIDAGTLKEELGLDKPLLRSIGHDFSKMIHGDFGRSLLTQQPIAPVLSRRFIFSLSLALLASFLTLILSLSIALPAAAHPGKAMDRFSDFFSAFSTALPIPWLGPILIVLLAVMIPIFPTERSIFLPAITLSISTSSFWVRWIRNRVREVLELGSAPGARARGIPEWRVLLKYGLAPASSSMLAYFGTQFGALLAGTFVTEIIFNWPGMGALLIDAVLKRDYPVIEAATFLAAVTCLLGTALGDIFSRMVDPREAS